MEPDDPNSAEGADPAILEYLQGRPGEWFYLDGLVQAGLAPITEREVFAYAHELDTDQETAFGADVAGGLVRRTGRTRNLPDREAVVDALQALTAAGHIERRKNPANGYLQWRIAE